MHNKTRVMHYGTKTLKLHHSTWKIILSYNAVPYLVKSDIPRYSAGYQRPSGGYSADTASPGLNLWVIICKKVGNNLLRPIPG